MRLFTVGSVFYIDYVNPAGQRRRVSTKTTDKHLAEKMMHRYKGLLYDGKDPVLETKRQAADEQARSITLSGFFPEFFERHSAMLAPGTQDYHKNSMKNIQKSTLSDMPLCDIRTLHIEKHCRLRMKNDKVGATAVNHEGKLIRLMLNKAVEWERLEHSPLKGYKLLKEPEPRDASNITVEQMAELLEALPEALSRIVELALLTGRRREEILSLEIENIIFHHVPAGTGEMTIKTKTAKKQTFPLGHQAVVLLKRLIGERTEGYVFINRRTGTRYKSIHRTFDRAVRKLGIVIVGGAKFCFHDLRRVHGYFFLASGGSLDQLRELLGHKDSKTTDRYARVQVNGRVLNGMPKIRRKEGGSGTSRSKRKKNS